MTVVLTEELVRRNSAKGRILAALHAAGERGVLNTELNKIAFRYGGRIHELRRAGYVIPEPTIEGEGCYRYVLRGYVTPAPAAAVTATPPPPASSSLQQRISAAARLLASVRRPRRAADVHAPSLF